jgi:O-antigen ligase
VILSASDYPLLTVPLLSSIFFIAALAFAMTIGPQTRPWTWGPAMLCLGLALACGLRCHLRNDIRLPGPLLLTLACITTAWFATRAILSPVAEHGLADLLLLAAAVGAFCWVRTIDGHVRAQRLFHWGIAALLAANLIVMYMQWKDPTFIPLFHSKPADKMLTGFFNHYIETSNFLVAVSLWTAAAALWGPHRALTKTLFLSLALAGLAGVVFSGGRGGVAGGAAGGAMFFVLMLIQAKHRKAKWFAPAVIAVPILAAGAAVYLFFGWQAAQKIRGMDETKADDITRLLDNNARLFAIGIALECIAQHPLAGGGARSFSWESHRFSDPAEYGDITTRRLEFVHNEFLQAASDYGIPGAILILLLIIAYGLNCLLRSMFPPPNAPPDPGDALRLGGLAALAGMATQACFAFSFHLIPGAILLGASLGMISYRGTSGDSHPSIMPMRLLLAAPALAAMGLLLWFGYAGSMATRALWKSEYSKYRHLFTASRMEDLAAAISWWPHSSLYEQRGLLLLESAGKPTDADFARQTKQAVNDLLTGAELHPYEPVFAVHLGSVYSLTGDDQQAERWFTKAVALQAKQEPAFRAHFSFAGHYLRRAQREFDPENPAQALESFENAASQIEIAIRKMHWPDKPMHEFRLAIHENLGLAKEADKDFKGALETYNFAATLRFGERIHYRSAVVLGKMAKEVWYQREPERALALFLNARHKIHASRGYLPAGVTPEQRQEYVKYLDRTIAFLRSAKVEPAK